MRVCKSGKRAEKNGDVWRLRVGVSWHDDYDDVSIVVSSNSRLLTDNRVGEVL
ncbi:MAG: hypothetical protein ACI9G1_001903, partial [Pirellulaceae bacterium]